MGRLSSSSGVSSGGGANCFKTFRLMPVAGCFFLTTGEYPKSLSTKKIISSSRINTSLLHTVLSQRCNMAFVLASSSSVPTPADVDAGGTAGARASGFDACRCENNFRNSECVRLTSRNCVVRNLGRLVWTGLAGRYKRETGTAVNHTYASNLRIGSFFAVRSRPVILICNLYCG